LFQCTCTVDRAYQELEQQSVGGADNKAAAAAVKEQEKKVAQTTNTVRLLEEKLREKEVRERQRSWSWQ
jgi:DNA-binding transcriptional regulator YhcF (GntR family)